MGLSSMEVAIVFIVFVLSVLIPTATGAVIYKVLPIVIIIYSPLIVLIIKMSDAFKKGNTNYLGSFFSFQQLPKKIEDKRHLFQMLNSNKK